MTVGRRNLCFFGRLLSSLGIVVLFLTAGSAWGQSGLPVSYETRISLPQTADVLGVNEVIFSWTTDATSGVITIEDVNDLIMKVDDVTPNIGGVYQDRIVVDGVIQPLLGPGGGASPPALPRTAANVAWRFNLNTQQVEEFGNLIGISEGDFSGLGFDGSVYQVEGSGGLPDYEIVTYPVEGVDQTWEAARDEAYARGGTLASLNTPTEEKLIFFKLRTHPEPINAGLWLGGYQKADSVEPAGGWRWLDGSFIPTTRSYTSYANWKRGQPDNGGGVENYVAAYVGGRFGWSDEANDAEMDGFIVEFAGGQASVTRFVDGAIDGDSSTEDQLLQRTGIVSSTTVRDFFAPPGQGTVFDVDLFEQEGNVVRGGTVNADVCIAPDPREPIIFYGEELEESEFEGFAGGSLVVSQLAGTGTCTGDLPLVSEADEYQTWEELLADVDLVVPEYYRSFFGEVTFVPLDSEDEVTIWAAWVSVAVIRTDGVEYDGPVSSVSFPESFVDYSNEPAGEIPACNNELDFRSLDVGGTNGTFGEWPNVEGIDVILQTAQCNRSWSLTRRTTHLSPMRFVGGGSAVESGTRLLVFQLKGISGTLAEAASCTDPTLLDLLADEYQSTLGALSSQDYSLAIQHLEEFARIANADDEYGDGFNNCAVEANYRGNFVARAISAAFTTWDRLLPENQDPETWEIYPLPEEFCGLVPDLRDAGEAGATCVAPL